ncbi:hypothetical protein TNIN_283881 [Trichonephila inaurata madagascariensis]|uniref:Uncharacterized protein n=1 Tax=Trichonephila inaurata madagascariensis TaxID=2747483 RepID=A0A8X7BT52_9ARAC|nr:hypothetical protein TNIN_283881 [Trichonephila inaurata madagascariensis]
MAKHFGILVFIALSTVGLSEKLLDLFHNVQCKGNYDSSKMATVYAVCRSVSYPSFEAPLCMMRAYPIASHRPRLPYVSITTQTNRNHKEDILEMINSLTMAKIQA